MNLFLSKLSEKTDAVVLLLAKLLVMKNDVQVLLFQLSISKVCFFEPALKRWRVMRIVVALKCEKIVLTTSISRCQGGDEDNLQYRLIYRTLCYS
jgi:hypothetical protein